VDIDRFVEEYYRDWNTLDGDRMAAKYAEDAVMEDPLLAEPARGREGIRAYYHAQFRELSALEYMPLDYGCGDDRVYIRWQYSFVRDGERLVFRGVSVKVFRDGLIAADLAYWAPERPSERHPA
jgi:ketosteroid isomerase-like protein